MASVSAEDGAILRGADIVGSTRSDMTTHVNTLRSDMESIATTQLDGQAATQFRQLMRRWDEDANRLIGALDNFETDLRGTQSSLDSTDEEQAQQYASAGTQNVNFTYPGA